MTDCPAWQLDIAHHDGADIADIAAITRRASSERPLPDEQPAAALRWRIVAALSASQDSREIKHGTTKSAPGLSGAGRRYLEEPTRARPCRPNIHFTRAFGSQPALAEESVDSELRAWRTPLGYVGHLRLTYAPASSTATARVELLNRANKTR